MSDTKPQAPAATATTEQAAPDTSVPSSADLVLQVFGYLTALLDEQALEPDGVSEAEIRHFVRKGRERLLKDPTLDGLRHDDVRQGLAQTEHFLLVGSVWNDRKRCLTAKSAVADAMLLCHQKPL